MSANADQVEYWNSEESEHWVLHADRYDRMLGGYVEKILDAASLHVDARLLDIGCGSGATTTAGARIATAGDALGVDLSGPMLRHARERATQAGVTNVAFEQADAQTNIFEPNARDAVISRFGVMFFDNPVEAFVNIARALRPGGRLTFACWKDLSANEWMLVPGMAASAHTPLPDFGAPDAPGPFAFGDPDRIQEILTAAGLTDVAIASVDEPLLLGGHGTLDEAVEFLQGTGMARALFGDAAPDAVERAIDAVREALAAYETPAGVELGAGVWLVTATR